MARQNAVKQQSTDRGLKKLPPELRVFWTICTHHLYLRAEVHDAEVVRGNRRVRRFECLSFAVRARNNLGHPIASERHIKELFGHHRLGTSRLQNVFIGRHNLARFHLRFDGQRHMHRHLVTVKVRVERAAHERMHLYRIAFYEHRTKRLDALPMERRRAVEQDMLIFDDMFENRPYFRNAVFDETTGAANVVCKLLFEELGNDKRPEQLECHVLWETALVEFEVGTNDDYRTTALIYALAEQILAEISLLAFEIVGQRFQRTAMCLAHRRVRRVAVADGVVDKRIDRLLQNALFVAQNDIRRVNINQFF